MKSVVLSILAAGSLFAQAKPLTPEEGNILKVGVSQHEFHYLGSGRIMAGIGKGFAESMLGLEAKMK